MIRETITPSFEFLFKSDSTILDTQYSQEGHYLGAVTSQGSIHIYKNPSQVGAERVDQFPICEYTDETNSYLKLAWSCDETLAVCSINKKVECFRLVKKKNQQEGFPHESDQIFQLEKVGEKKCPWIPTFVVWYPSAQNNILTVGYASGYFGLYYENLETIEEIQAHEETINWISWEPYFQNSVRNNWMEMYYPENVSERKGDNKSHFLATGSSDTLIKIWYLEMKTVNESGNIFFPSEVKRETGFKLELTHTISAHSKEIRQIMWRPNFFSRSGSRSRSLVSCSEDGFVRFFQISMNSKGKVVHKENSFKYMKGPVFRAEYNELGNLIAISYRAEEEGRVTTKVFKSNEGRLGEEIDFTK